MTKDRDWTKRCFPTKYRELSDKLSQLYEPELWLVGHKCECGCGLETRIGTGFIPCHKKEWKEKQSEAHKGKKLSEDHKKKIGQAILRLKRHHSEETKIKISKSHFGITHNENEHTRKLKSEIQHRPETIEKQRKAHYGLRFKLSERTKALKKELANKPENRQKQRELALLRIRKQGVVPQIGKLENEILNEIEIKNGIVIERQVECLGYVIDGYDRKNNIIYEIDEIHHRYPKQMLKDIQRQSELTKYLKCKVVRIRIGWYYHNSKEIVDSNEEEMRKAMLIEINLRKNQKEY